MALFSDIGVVQESGKKFWSTKDPGQTPFSYQAGVGQVIKGWDQGLLGMKLGEERQVTPLPLPLLPLHAHTTTPHPGNYPGLRRLLTMPPH